ncbi:aldose 1-epimerase family protein [Daejeonella sp.]|uniref:aldose 1-epimerase family protein n=1 Tax=Daejeonella sp. TaxID=2805397 RepID=UPI0025C33F0B|nr:aldose 1-epimerase family protein [Daejeonella sp.]
MIFLENNSLKVRINLKGAELSSVFNKLSGVEHLWQADPSVWAFHAPNLFPIVGSCLNNELLINGNKYPIKRHGFARHSQFELIDQSATQAKFQIKYSEASLEQYPYKFAFEILYKLDESKISISYQVRNLDNQIIHFSLGAHPAFNIPFNSEELMSDYYIEFSEDESLEKHLLNKDGYFTGLTQAVPLDTRKLQLDPDLFKSDALVFKELNSREVRLKSHKSNHYISVSFPDFTSLGIWAPMGAPFVCIEPWLGYADHEGEQKEFKLKEGVISLEEFGEFAADFNIEIH